MWLLVARGSSPDLPYLPGRRWLAVLDALLWPLAWVALFRVAPAPLGVVGPLAMAVAVLCASGRLHRAIWRNHRYRFTTWHWGRLLAGLLLLGTVLKLAAWV
jgi:hypothetical protein